MDYPVNAQHIRKERAISIKWQPITMTTANSREASHSIPMITARREAGVPNNGIIDPINYVNIRFGGVAGEWSSDKANTSRMDYPLKGKHIPKGQFIPKRQFISKGKFIPKGQFIPKGRAVFLGRHPHEHDKQSRVNSLHHRQLWPALNDGIFDVPHTSHGLPLKKEGFFGFAGKSFSGGRKSHWRRWWWSEMVGHRGGGRPPAMAKPKLCLRHTDDVAGEHAWDMTSKELI
ncbi:uncharacterized protein G2W53_027135 [Senna tora]|uniref:Uncharacterized protein n=1 Tax=Senna tora TaxID=362788 RepID=A0A834TIS3_9FABA|nr:uncharacterized protein G2W53_027135 [Senna tora]